jgi:predicted nucleotidyltransferase
MENSDIEPYLKYWQERQFEQDLKNQRLAQQARQELSQVIELLIDRFQVSKIILFGSLAKGTFHQDSDIDLAVAGIEPSKYFQALAQVNNISDRWIDLKPLESLEPHFLKRVLETGECLYDSNFS